jgi:hypothetical protein
LVRAITRGPRLRASENEDPALGNTLGGSVKMAPQLCQKCKQAHPGRVCDYDEKGECAETIDISVAKPCNEPSKDQDD